MTAPARPPTEPASAARPAASSGSSVRTMRASGSPAPMGAAATWTDPDAGVATTREQTTAMLASHAGAARRARPPAAALLALTVVKLFLFDLSHVSGIERIVSFIGIGVLLLLIGYFSPLPPKAAAQQDDHA